MNISDSYNYYQNKNYTENIVATQIFIKATTISQELDIPSIPCSNNHETIYYSQINMKIADFVIYL